MKIGGFIDFDMLITNWWATMGSRCFFGPLGGFKVDFLGSKSGLKSIVTDFNKIWWGKRIK